MNAKIEEFKSRWLMGSTCHRQNRSVFWVSDDDRFVVMKHHGHSEYINRFSGTAYCPTYYALYDLDGEKPDCLGRGYLWRAEGRWKYEYNNQISKAIAGATGASLLPHVFIKAREAK